MHTTRGYVTGLLLLTVGCDRAPTTAAADEARTAVASTPAIQPSVTKVPAPAPLAASVPSSSAEQGSAEVGRIAPAFSLKDLDGKLVSLADFTGKTVVLEWFNPGCPFVRAAHTKGSLVDAAQRAQKKGVVWLAINSGAPGQQGHGVEANRAGVTTFGLEHPVLLDEDGQVGRSYGAQRTPHLFVIDPAGKLAYAGAVDNSPDGEGESPEGGKLVAYVDQALEELARSQPVSVPRTKPYGCSVKYAK